MECPACGRPVQEQRKPDGTSKFVCSQCGWGILSSFDGDSGRGSARPAAGSVLALWGLSLLIVLGPFVALRFAIPMVMDTGAAAFAEASDRLIGLLNLHYWWVMAVYVFLAAAFSPEYDRNNVGWFGGLLDNPFSWADDWERQKRRWAFFLFPGKVVAAAFKATWDLSTHRAG